MVRILPTPDAQRAYRLERARLMLACVIRAKEAFVWDNNEANKKAWADACYKIECNGVQLVTELLAEIDALLLTRGAVEKLAANWEGHISWLEDEADTGERRAVFLECLDELRAALAPTQEAQP